MIFSLSTMLKGFFVFMNAFSRLHPTVTTAYFAAVIGIAMFSVNPVIEFVSLAGGIAFCAVITGRDEKKKDLLFYVFLMLLIAVTNPIFSHGGVTPLFYLGDNPVTFESVIYGVYIAVMTVSVMLWCKALTAVTTSDKIVYLFGKTVPQLSLIFSMSLRFVPLLKEQAKKVTRAQRAMGLYSGEKKSDRLRGGMRVISVLIGWSLENAVETGKAMKAKGYGLKGHTNYSDFRFCKSDFTALVFCLAFFATVLYGIVSGSLDFGYYPIITGIKADYCALICFGAYACLAFMPFVLEMREVIKWKFLKSKI